MATVQNFQPYDCSSYANFKAWASAIGAALSSLGFAAVDTSPSTTMNTSKWGTATTVPGLNFPAGILMPRVVGLAARGNWSGGTLYSSGLNGSGAINYTLGDFTVSADMAVDTADGVGNLCYLCWLQTQYKIVQVTQCIALTPTISGGGQGVSAVSGNVTTYTMSNNKGLAKDMAITFAGFNNAANNGTFIICTVPSGTTLTVFTNGHVVETATGAATASVSVNTTVYRIQATTTGSVIGGPTAAMNVAFAQWIGHSYVFAGCTNAGNNVTKTLIAAGVDSNTTNADIILAVTNSTGVSETPGAGATATENTAPHLDIYSSTALENHWIPYYYEVWQTNDGNSPVYFRFVYASTSTSIPVINYSLGTGVTASNFPNGNTPTWNSATTPIEIRFGNTGSARGGTGFECDFAGNGNTNGDCWFNILLWRDATDVSAPLYLGFDRARTSTGGQVDTYCTVLTATQNTAGVTKQQSIFKPQAGSVGPLNSNPASTGAWVSLCCIILTTLLYGGMIPALPVFPLVGNVGNPILCAVVFALNDVTPGQMASVVMYNVTHTYICVKNGMNNVLSNNGNNAMGMRFE